MILELWRPLSWLLPLLLFSFSFLLSSLISPLSLLFICSLVGSSLRRSWCAIAESQQFPLVLRSRVRECFARAKRQHPRTRDALRLLQEALDAEVPPVVARRAPRKRKLEGGVAATGVPGQAATGAFEAAATGVATRQRKFYYQACRLRKQRDTLAAQLQRFTGAKLAAQNNQLSEEWLLRVILAKPNASARAVEQMFADIVGSDVRTVSRGSINSVRDAWVEMYKPMVLRVGADLVATLSRVAKASKAEFAPIYCLRVQDEADIRLRSEHARDGPAVPSRSRSSKVQQSVLILHGAGGQAVRLPCELEALGDKSAPTLATSFERLLRSVVASVTPQPQAAAPEIWVIHVLLGDGIATNEKAAKILWACVKQRHLAPGARYMLLCLKCLTHQAGLTAKSSVMGRTATTGAGEGELHKAITGVASRLFKFVICDYFEEVVFSRSHCQSVRSWLSQD